MGTYSFFEYSAGDCVVDWDAMDTDVLFKFRRFEFIYEKKLTLLSEVGAALDESKLFGYMDYPFFAAFNEFNRHLVPNGQNPLWIFSYEGDDNSRGLRFYPGDKIEILNGEWM